MYKHLYMIISFGNLYINVINITISFRRKKIFASIVISIETIEAYAMVYAVGFFTLVYYKIMYITDVLKRVWIQKTDR